MYFTDPTLYGATLPRREIPLQTPVFGHMVTPWQNLPLQNLPYQSVPLQNLPVQGVPLQNLPYQGVPFQNLPVQALPFQSAPIQNLPIPQIPLQNPPWQQFVPPTYQPNALPLAKHPLGFPAPYMTAPYAPLGVGHQVPNSFYNVPFYGFQRPW